MALPPGWEAQIRPRSGLAQKGVQVTNSPGTIDDDYRGRLMVVLNNAGREIVNIKHGDRFAQMALKPVWYFSWNIVDELESTERGDAGFGSTGV
jgi:dUTP pyrophosphatase